MSMQDTLSGAKNAFAFLSAYINTVGDDVGMDKAVALLTKMTEAVGAEEGKRMREQAGIDDVDAQTAYSLVKAIPNNLGIVTEVVEQSATRVRIRCQRCSVYDGFQAAGTDSKTTEQVCLDGSMRCMDAAVKQLNPKLSYGLVKFRSGPEDFCEEQIVMA